MELKISPYKKPEQICFNYEELKKMIIEKASLYESVVYTDEQIKSAKKDRANLNKFKKALNDERIKLENEYMTPFNEFKSQIKELLVEDIMSINPTFVSKDMSITEVSNIIMKTGFNGLPVVENDEVVGIITQTDILRLIEKLES